MERRDIERSNFSSVRKGYDPAEVDDHLRSVADAMEAAREEASQDQSASGVASRGVKQILEAAEKLAADIETQARREAERTETEAQAQSSKIVEEAREQAAAEESRARRAGERLKRANAELGRLREALAGLQPVVAEEGEEAAAVAPAGVTEEVPTVVHGEPMNGDGAVEEAQESTAETAHEAAPEGAGETVEAEAVAGDAGDGEGARLIALNMALTGTPREETAKYLQENFELEDAESILDDAYSRAR